MGIWALTVCVGGLAVLGVVHLIKEASKEHPPNRKQGIGVMLFGIAFLIWQLTDRFSPGWVAIASIPVGLFLVIGMLWILSEVRQGIQVSTIRRVRAQDNEQIVVPLNHLISL
jgi:hypothetical protein